MTWMKLILRSPTILACFKHHSMPSTPPRDRHQLPLRKENRCPTLQVRMGLILIRGRLKFDPKPQMDSRKATSTNQCRKKRLFSITQTNILPTRSEEHTSELQ